jgi:hypothetical protein
VIAFNRLFGLGSVYGANAGASAALDAGIGIYLVMIFALRDSGYRTLACASAALDAIFRNLISHGIHLLIKFNISIVSLMTR